MSFKIKKSSRKDIDKWRDYVAGILTQFVEHKLAKSKREAKAINWLAHKYDGRYTFGWSSPDNGNGSWVVRCEKSKQDSKVMIWFGGRRNPCEGIKELGFSIGPGGKGDVAMAACIVRFLRTVMDEIVFAYEHDEPPRLVEYVKQMQEEWEPEVKGQHDRLNKLHVTPYILRS